MKYVFIEKHQAEFSIKAMCRVLRVARSGWYTWCQRRTGISPRQQFRQHCDSVVLAAAFTRSKQRYGAPRLTDELRAQGYHFNVKTVAASLRRQGLRAKASRKFSPVSYRAYFLTAVILCFFTDTSLPQAQHPYRYKRLDNHHALKVIPGLHSQRFHVPPLFHALWYSSVSQRRS
ncbi:IS3 ORF2 [Shigella sonnei]|nr:IS3 ORF2 [Shigella sonnei]